MNIDDSRSRADVAALKGHEDISTTSAMGKIAQDANGGKQGPLLHASDKSYDEVMDEQRSLGGNKGAAVDGAAHALEVFGEVAEIGAVGVGGAVALPVVGLAFGIHHYVENHVKGQERDTALSRDEQRVALITHLALPDGFKNGELAKYSHSGQSFQSNAQKMTTFMAGQDHALVALLQLHCDQGMNSAQDMIRSSVTDKNAFLSAHPEVAKRYADDQAFKEGFDAMLWAHGKGGDEYKKLTDDLTARDARYNAAGVTFRV